MNLSILSDNLIDEIKSSTYNLNKIKSLIEAGADINHVSTENGYTPLMYAVESGNDEAAEYLLWQGAYPLVKNYQGEIASNLCDNDSQLYLKLKDFELLYATLQNDLDGVKMIVEAGALVDFQGHGGYSALMIAVEESLEEMVDYFLELGADMSSKCYDGRGVFELVSSPVIHSSLRKMKALRDEISNRPEKMTFRFFMRPSSSKFFIN